MTDAIAKGEVTQRNEHAGVERLRIEHGDNIAALIKSPGSNAWVLTAFEKRPSGERGVGFDTSAPTQAEPMLTRRGLGADDNSSIDHPGNSALDASLFADVQQGSTATELLTRIAAESTNERNRAIATQLLAFGPDATVGFGSKVETKFQAERPHSDFVASYSPKNHHVSLYASENAERNLVHELTHAATAKALKKGGRAALQMKALFAEIKRSGAITGMYGMANVDEFVAEAHSNPAFQAALQAIPAGKYKSMWARFVDIVRAALGMSVEQTDALDYALTVGQALMGENGGNNVRTSENVFGNIAQTVTRAFKDWFGDWERAAPAVKWVAASVETDGIDLTSTRFTVRRTPAAGYYFI